MRYTAWGEVRYTWGSTPTDYTYTGQYSNVPEFGLMFYQARWYDPGLGRFAQADSIIPVESQGVQAWDRYAYVNNSPTGFRDPSGHWLETLWDIASVALDIVDIAQNGLTWENGAALAVDVASVILPAVPAVGSVVLKAGKAANAVDNALDAARLLSHADEAVEALRAAERATDQAQSFLRTIDRAPTNPRNYELRLGDVTDGGLGLSTVADPPVSPDTLLRETGRSRAISIPASDIPEGLQWVKTEGHYGNSLLDNNHWELWAPTQYGSMSPAQYVAWWNSQVAPELARRAGSWSIFK